MIITKTSTLLRDNTENPAILDSIAALKAAGFSDNVIAYFTERAVNVLNDYAELIGEGTEFRYGLSKGLVNLRLTVRIPGESYDPFRSGSNAKERTLANVTSLNLSTEAAHLAHEYQLGTNVLTVSIPLSEKKKRFLKDPMLYAIAAGLLLGFLCRGLPADLNSFVVDELASPLMEIILHIIAGITGPVIFISMTTSIIALESINSLTNLGFKIMRRILGITLFVTAVSIAVAEIFFPNIGQGSVSFAPKHLV